MIAMFLMLAVGQAVAPAQPPEGLVHRPDLISSVPIGHLVIPDEISPAVMPYMECLLASKGIALRDSSGRPVSPVAAAGANCAPQRVSAAQNADRMLERQGHENGKERAAFVEKVLTSIDGFQWPTMPSGSSTAPDAPAGQPAPVATTSSGLGGEPGPSLKPTKNQE